MLDLKVKCERCDAPQLILTDIIGFRVGESVDVSIVGLPVTGSRLGFSVGDSVIIKTVGAGVSRVGAPVGTGVDKVGASVGTGEGFFVVGLFVGFLVGRLEGRSRLGFSVGDSVIIKTVGAGVSRVGAPVGTGVTGICNEICNEGTMDGFQPTESCPGVGLGDNWVVALPGTFAAPTVGFGVNTTT